CPPWRPPQRRRSCTAGPRTCRPPTPAHTPRRPRRRGSCSTSAPQLPASERTEDMSRKYRPGVQITPAYTGRLATNPVPSLRLPDDPMAPEAVYRFISDELMLDGSSRLNLATFVTTWMDPEAEKLMAQTFDKNMIDKDEYPATAAIEQRCVCMVADLFHAEDLRDDDPSSATGVSTIGSSEAVMLAGL